MIQPEAEESASVAPTDGMEDEYRDDRISVSSVEFSLCPSAAKLNRTHNSLEGKKENNQIRKIVYLVRHAQAEHNVQEIKAEEGVKARHGTSEEAEEARQNVLKDPNYLDAHLSMVGEEQVRSANDTFHKLLEDTHYPQPEKVFVSPLRRTLQTATILFPDHQNVVAKEMLREKRTGRPCDERKSAEEEKSLFPHVDFTEIAELDVLSNAGYWYQGNEATVHEENDDVMARASQLLPYLKNQKEKVIAVVSHKGFLREFCRGPLSGKIDLMGRNELKSVFNNAEVRILELLWDENVSRGEDAKLKARAISLSQSIAEPIMEISVKHGTALRKTILHKKQRKLRKGGGISSSVGYSTQDDGALALMEAWEMMEEKLGGTPQVVFLFCTSLIDRSLIAERLSVIISSTEERLNCKVIGGTSSYGVYTNDGLSRIGLLGFKGLAEKVGIGVATGADIKSSASDSGMNAARQAVQQFGSDSDKYVTDLLFICCSPGAEDDVLTGIHQICGNSPISFGGSSADDSAANPNIEPGQWWQLAYSQDVNNGVVGSWTDAVVVAAFQIFSDANVLCTLSHCYGPIAKEGEIIASDRLISMIDGCPAAKKFNEWSQDAILIPYQKAVSTKAPQPIMSETALLPMAVESKGGIRLIHPKFVFPDGAIECFGTFEGFESVCLLNSKRSDLVSSAATVTRSVLELAEFKVKTVIVDFCAGTASALRDLEILRHALTIELERLSDCDLFCFFSFGEIGMISGRAAHGNLMVNIALFG